MFQPIHSLFPVYFYILYRLFQNKKKKQFKSCYMKNEAKRTVKTANLLFNFLISVSVAPEYK